MTHPEGPLLLALDQGTTSSRAIVFDRTGRPLASAWQAHRQSYPQPGWVEHDPEEILDAQVRSLREAVARSGVDPRSIAAVGLTNQRETVVVWDRDTGAPIHPAIVWQCRRTAPAVETLLARNLSARIAEKTGLVPDAYFSGTKIAWILDHVPGARRRAEEGGLAAGTIDSWLLFRLTGGRVHATDPSNASRTLLYNFLEHRWDPELCGMMDVPLSMLPEVRPSSGRFGDLDPSILGVPVPVAGMAGDQQAALFGQACFEAGRVKNTYGTGCFLLSPTGRAPVRSRNGLLATVAWDLGDGPHYALEGSVFNAGSAIQWLRDELGLVGSAPECDRLADTVPDTGGVVFVPAFTGLGAPYWDMYARGTLTGLTRGTTRAHLARAVLESIAFQSDALLSAMAADTGAPVAEIRVDGGASVSDFLMQLQADLSGVPVVRPAVTETTAWGAASLAGLGVGVHDGLQDLEACWRMDRRFVPTREPAWRESRRTDWEQAVETARHHGRKGL